ncbi:PAS domain S-box protein [Paenibacillus sp.]|uniref:PAS domain S-box protein n=1 Tax=Paenibacillus sp. TaxID=58172 RepID=UPI002D7241A1|nr:PAS domain S-box protein [Paenibacillus sp.]HZG83520.1 PAS domain S-box protein [Paenibacillus sp.]
MSKQSEQAFMRNAPLFYRIFQSMHDIAFLMKAERREGKLNFRYEFLNEAASRHTSLTEADYGKTIEEVYPNEFGAFLQEQYEKACSTMQPVEFDMDPEAAGFESVSTLHPIADEEGQCTHVFCLVRDVSRSKIAEAELDNQRRMLDAVIQGTADALLIGDAHGRILLSNRAFQDMFGMSDEEMAGRTPAEFGMIPPGAEGEAVAIIESLRRGERFISREVQRRRKDGTVLIAEATYSSILDEQGAVKYMSVSYRDITQRKAMERELEISRQRYESLFAHHPDAVFTLDSEGKFLSANESVKKVTGYPVEQLLHQSFLPLVQPEYTAETLARFYMSLQNEPQSYKSAIRHKDGRWVDLAVQNIPIVVDGDIVGIYGIAKDVTDEKARQEALRDAKEQLETFWNNTTEAIFLVSVDGTIVKVNKAFEKLFGYTEVEVTGLKPEYTIIPDFLKHDTLSISARLLQGQSIINHETQRITRDGRILNILASYTPVQDGNGQVNGATVFYRDITDRKLAEEEIRRSEEKYRLIAENMTDLIAILEPDLRVTYASPSYLKVLGINPTFYEENKAGTLIDEGDRPKVMAKFKELLESKQPIVVEYLFKRRNAEGQPLYVETRGTPILDDRGNVSKVLVVSRDISKRKQYEEALKESEQRFRVIAEHTLDVIKLADRNGIHTYASPSHLSAFGWEPEHYAGKSIFHDTHPEDMARLQQAFAQLALGKETRSIELRKLTSNGDWVWMESSMTPVLDEKNDIKHIVIVSRNVTDRKRYEEQITYLAYHDSLTGLPNRRLFLDRLDQAIKTSKRSGESFAVMMLDCDRFKTVNDQMGHDVGDELIKGFAARLQDCVRESDTLSATHTVSRLGGDEFILLLRNLREVRSAELVAARILDSIRKPWTIGDYVFHATTSIGIVVCPSTANCETKDLMKQADLALYEAKAAGRNTYKINVI